MDKSNMFQEDFFKNELREKFIALLESKRGVQSILAKSIGKPAGYFSDVKRGSPVNAIHLKAVGLVFGYETVIELLGLSNVSNLCCEDKPVGFADFINTEIVSVNEDLVYLEKNNPEAFEKAKVYIKGLKDGTAAKRQ